MHAYSAIRNININYNKNIYQAIMNWTENKCLFLLFTQKITILPCSSKSVLHHYPHFTGGKIEKQESSPTNLTGLLIWAQ